VRRPDLDEVVEFEELLDRFIERSCRGLHDTGLAGGGFEQVGSPEVAHKHEVSRGDADRTIGSPTQIGYQVGQVLRGVPRRVDGCELDVADLEFITMPQQGMGIVRADQPLVLPIGVAFIRGIDVYPALREFTHTREVVRMDVGIDCSRNFEAFFLGQLQILVDVSFGVDDDGFAGFLAADEVSVLGQFCIPDLSEQHGGRTVGLCWEVGGRTLVRVASVG